MKKILLPFFTLLLCSIAFADPVDIYEHGKETPSFYFGVFVMVILAVAISVAVILCILKSERKDKKSDEGEEK